MSDRCWWRATVRRGDFGELQDVLGAILEEPARGDGWIEVEDSSADYGHFEKMATAAKAGLVFFGWHDGGDEYGPLCFVAWDGELYTIDCDHGGWPVVPLEPGKAAVAPEAMKLAEKYWVALAKAKVAMGLPEQDQ